LITGRTVTLRPVRLVQKSLMPKGVDHLGLPTDSVADSVVQKSLMPKGVDHNGGKLCLTRWRRCKNL